MSYLKACWSMLQKVNHWQQQISLYDFAWRARYPLYSSFALGIGYCYYRHDLWRPDAEELRKVLNKEDPFIKDLFDKAKQEYLKKQMEEIGMA